MSWRTIKIVVSRCFLKEFYHSSRTLINGLKTFDMCLLYIWELYFMTFGKSHFNRSNILSMSIKANKVYKMKIIPLNSNMNFTFWIFLMETFSDQGCLKLWKLYIFYIYIFIHTLCHFWNQSKGTVMSYLHISVKSTNKSYILKTIKIAIIRYYTSKKLLPE